MKSIETSCQPVSIHRLHRLQHLVAMYNCQMSQVSLSINQMASVKMIRRSMRMLQTLSQIQSVVMLPKPSSPNRTARVNTIYLLVSRQRLTQLITISAQSIIWKIGVIRLILDCQNQQQQHRGDYLLWMDLEEMDVHRTIGQTIIIAHEPLFPLEMILISLIARGSKPHTSTQLHLNQFATALNCAVYAKKR